MAAPARLRLQATQMLPIRLDHSLAVAELSDRHWDPFDRLLVAQSRIEDLPIISVDPAFDDCNIEVIRADA